MIEEANADRAAPGRRSAKALWAGVGAIACWCFTGISYAEGSRALGPMVFTAFSCVVGTVAAIVLHAAIGRPLRHLVAMPLRVWVAGFFGIAVYSVLLTLAIGVAPDRDVAQVALVNYLWPAILVVTGHFLLKEKLNAALTIAGVTLGFAGVIAARGIETLARPPADFLPHLLAFTAALLWAVYSVLLRRWRVPEEQSASAAEFALCALLAAAIGLLRGEWGHLSRITPQAAFWVIFCGIGPVGLAYYGWEYAMKRGPAHLIAVLSFFIPIVSATIMGLAFRQALSPGLVPGAAMIALGAYLARAAARGSGPAA